MSTYQPKAHIILDTVYNYLLGKHEQIFGYKVDNDNPSKIRKSLIFGLEMDSPILVVQFGGVTYDVSSHSCRLTIYLAYYGYEISADDSSDDFGNEYGATEFGIVDKALRFLEHENLFGFDEIDISETGLIAGGIDNYLIAGQVIIEFQR